MVKLSPHQAWPEFEALHECERKFENGASFKASGGILPQGKPSKGRGPFVLCYHHRVISPYCSEPLDELVTPPRFLCRVELLEADKGTWPLLKHKDGLLESELQEQLFSALAEEYRPFLEQLSQEAEEVEIANVNAELTLMFRQMFPGCERRNPARNESEPVTPVIDSEQHREKANRWSNGNGHVQIERSMPKSGLHINVAPLERIIGKVDVNRQRVLITMNRDHPAVCVWLKQKSRDRLFFAAMALFANHQILIGRENPSQLKLPFIDIEGHRGFVDLLTEWAIKITEREEDFVARE
jgi:hypothetical protein